jgi:hypothetical protein
MLDSVIQIALNSKAWGENKKNHHTPSWFLEACKKTLLFFNSGSDSSKKKTADKPEQQK